MNEQDVRALVREAIERHRPPFDSTPLVRSAGLQAGHHPSHILLNVLPGSDVEDGMCVIEPRVRCNHCGFCQSYGH